MMDFREASPVTIGKENEPDDPRYLRGTHLFPVI
jgi:hypothetical protein